MIKNPFSRWLNERLAADQRTNVWLGRRVGVSAQMVGLWRRGSIPRRGKAAAIAKALDVPTDVVVRLVDESRNA